MEILLVETIKPMIRKTVWSLLRIYMGLQLLERKQFIQDLVMY